MSVVGVTLASAVSVLGEMSAAPHPSAGTSPDSVVDKSVLWYRSVSSGITTAAPKALDLVVSNAAAILVLATVATIATLRITRWFNSRSLAQRAAFLALPTESFDPELEEVLRLATQLSRSRRAVHRFVPRRCDAVRLRLVALPGGRVVQLIEGPKRASSVLRLGGYAEVELLPPDTLLQPNLVGMGAPMVAHSEPDDDAIEEQLSGEDDQVEEAVAR